ncbi:hypothetical protein CCP4SC76_1910010 [Gammaproteobacteria bacterium]
MAHATLERRDRLPRWSVGARKKCKPGNEGCPEKRLADKRRALKNRAKWIRDYLFSGMQTAGLKKIKSPNGLFTLSIRKNPPSVTIDDQSLIPDRFIRTITEVSVDKAALREELKIREVPGARLEAGERLEIR